MRSTILVAACIFNFQAIAQNEQWPKPTQFNKFINQPGIEWAAYSNGTIRFDRLNFNKLLVLRLAKKEIRASLPIFRYEYVNYLNKISIDKEKLNTQGDPLPMFDSAGNRIHSTFKEPPQIVDTSPMTITAITQILYIEHKTLKSYVSWVTPTNLPITTSSGVFLGTAEYFAACFNFKYNYQPAKQSKISLLGQTKQLIRLDTIEVENKLKELYGRNVVETLWPYILKGDIKTFSFDKNKKLNPNEIKDTLVYTARIAVPVYDTNGNVTSYMVPSEILSPKVFTAIELVQDWYYDYTKNIVFNKIREVYLYARKWAAEGQDKEASPILKIFF